MTYKNTNNSNDIALNALLLLYKHNTYLLRLMLDTENYRIFHPEWSIDERCSGMSSGETLMIRIGLDIWNGSGDVHFNELYRKLDVNNFQQVMQTLQYLHSH